MRRRCARPVNDAGRAWVWRSGVCGCGRGPFCGVGFCCVDHFARVNAGFLGPCAHKMVHMAHARGVRAGACEGARGCM